jgi:hypothetical protein
MFSQLPRRHSTAKALASLGIALLAAVLALSIQPARPFLSSWAGPRLAGKAGPQDVAGLSGQAEPGAAEEQGPLVGEALPVGDAGLQQYNQGSALQEAAPGGQVSYYRRDLTGGGTIAYFVVLLDKQVHLEVLNADGATPGSDAGGDTIWTDGRQHLARVVDMVRAPYAARDKMTLLGAMAFGFHGDVRTSDEGTVVISGQIHRVNPGRAALCITTDGQARVGLFDAAKLADCEQAIGAGPVILWRGKIANPDVAAENGEFVPFNPLGEDFVQLAWRRKIYTGPYPKSVVGVGMRADGGSYLVMLTSYGVAGVEVARQLKAMGCTEALGGDDDTSTQAVWRGTPVAGGNVRPVPDALAVYLRE